MRELVARELCRVAHRSYDAAAMEQIIELMWRNWLPHADAAIEAMQPPQTAANQE